MWISYGRLLEQAQCLFTCRRQRAGDKLCLPSKDCEVKIGGKKWDKERQYCGVTPDEFPAYRECRVRGGTKEMPFKKRQGMRTAEFLSNLCFRSSYLSPFFVN